MAHPSMSSPVCRGSHVRFVLNFVLLAGLAYAAAFRLSRSPVTRISRPSDPVKRVIYTESELEEFKRQGRR